MPPFITERRFAVPVRGREIIPVREREILRVTGTLHVKQDDSVAKACNEVLRWAQNRAIAPFPHNAWDLEAFEQFSSGRSRVCVRLRLDEEDVWAIRVEDPDSTRAGRIWTTEVAVISSATKAPRFSARLMVGSPEGGLSDVEPHVPGVVRQVIARPGLYSGVFRLTDKPAIIREHDHAALLIDALLDTSRTLPIIALSVPEFSSHTERPLLDADTLAQACAGLAIVIILPAEFAWTLTDRIGKRLSVYEGAVRIYLPGFTEDANPFGGHELILPDRFATAEGVAGTLKRLRWMAAIGSVSRLQIGKDLPSFAALRLQSLEQQRLSLQGSGASDSEQLEAARGIIDTVQAQLEESERFQEEFSALHSQAEERAEGAETQLKASGFRIQQLLQQLSESGVEPDANIAPPSDWEQFAEWCDVNLAGRVILTPQARRELKSSVFLDVSLVARCLLWLANDFRLLKMSDGDGSLRDRTIEPGIINSHCGSDTYTIEWQSNRHDVDWHIKSGGNTRDRQRCLRIYYFWDTASQQAVIASMPEHRRTDAS